MPICGNDMLAGKSAFNGHVWAVCKKCGAYGSGLTNKAVVQLTSDMREEKNLKKMQQKFERIFSSSGRIFTVPAGYTISP